jgi:predicted GIY-YIG superfamily endonuclease
MDEFEGRDSEPLTLHKYLYANSNPVSYLDPSGLVGLLDTQIGKMVESTLNKMSTVNMRFVMRKSGCWAVKIGLEKGIESGIYLFLDASGAGGFYTGMSVDIERRLAEHAKRVVQPILRISANVSPQVLRQLEQTIYNIVKEAAAAAGKNTTNKINPLREQMRKLLSKAIPLC